MNEYRYLNLDYYFFHIKIDDFNWIQIDLVKMYEFSDSRFFYVTKVAQFSKNKKKNKFIFHKNTENYS